MHEIFEIMKHFIRNKKDEIFRTIYRGEIKN